MKADVLTKRNLSIVLSWLVSISLLMLYSYRLMRILPLYTDTAVRVRVQAEIQRFTEANGWLISNVNIVMVEDKKFRMLYTEHRRGPDTVDCWDYYFSSNTWDICAK